MPEKACIVWKIKQFQGQKEYMMHAHFGLPSISSGAFAIAAEHSSRF